MGLEYYKSSDGSSKVYGYADQIQNICNIVPVQIRVRIPVGASRCTSESDSNSGQVHNVHNMIAADVRSLIDEHLCVHGQRMELAVELKSLSRRERELYCDRSRRIHDHACETCVSWCTSVKL